MSISERPPPPPSPTSTVPRYDFRASGAQKAGPQASGFYSGAGSPWVSEQPLPRPEWVGGREGTSPCRLSHPASCPWPGRLHSQADTAGAPPALPACLSLPPPTSQGRRLPRQAPFPPRGHPSPARMRACVSARAHTHTRQEFFPHLLRISNQSPLPCIFGDTEFGARRGTSPGSHKQTPGSWGEGADENQPWEKSAGGVTSGKPPD